MPEFFLHRSTRHNCSPRGFTLVELLTVMAIIAILAALVLAAGAGVMAKAARSRATVEIKAMSDALEAYKNDNGVYPVASLTPASGSILTGPPSATYEVSPIADTNYKVASQGLFLALTGQAYMTATPVVGAKSYITLRSNQVGAPAGPNSYVQDPWNYPYGYSTGDAKNPQVLYPNNGTGFFDLWSTGGTITSTTTDPTAPWVTNWK
jgi:prepilin-type N-terminal cleavage/methylation domain-containing protein